jgi:hypothetical protein
LCLKPDKTADSELKELLLGERFGEAVFPAVQARASRPPSREDVQTYTAPTILTYADNPLSFEDLIVRWFDLRDELRDTFVLLNAPLHARSIYDEHRYSSTFQSAEHLAKKRTPSKDRSPEEHDRRVSAIVNAARESGVNQPDVDWAERVLKARNDKPLATLIEQLATSTGSIGAQIIAALPRFARISTQARTGVSHPGLRRRLGPAGRYWLADALRWIIRARLLMDLGVPVEEVQRRVVSRGSFRQMLDELRRIAAN